jgi:hypothetical protein
MNVLFTYTPMLDLSPAHLHVALNHIPIIGLAVASFPILLGIVAQCRTTIATGLLATLLCAAAMPAIMQTGGKAADAFDNGSCLPPLDEAGKNALNNHASRAETTTAVVYASALLSVLALLALIKFPQAARWLAFAVLLGNGISILLSIWTAQAGGLIRHQEFRPKAPSMELSPSNNILAAPPTNFPVPTPSVTPTTLVTPQEKPEPSAAQQK